VNLLWVDAGNGAAGDMLLAALIDAGADARGLDGLGIPGLELRVETTRRYGMRALRVVVEAPETAVPRRLPDVLRLVAELPDPVHSFARAVFERLARAEAHVHGTTPEEVHFHEVGALDAIADIVGCGLALDSLGLLDSGVTAVVSPVAVGSGTVHTAHGRLPVPVPGTVQLLADAGAPIAAHPGRFELCTPTGAALLATIATGWGPVPAGTLRRVGVGAGTADPAGHPNVLRVLVGDAAPGPDGKVDELVVVEATVDDLDPRLWPDVLDALHQAGALDAWCAPVLMRKGRPGHVLTALAVPSTVDGVAAAVFRHTTTLGLRTHPVSRRALDRDRVDVGPGIGVKRGRLAGEVVTAQPEYEDVRAAARASGRPVREVLDEARAAATLGAYRVVPAVDVHHLAGRGREPVGEQG
jgi:uncharacterized protein (TIGR00299 family) protein